MHKHAYNSDFSAIAEPTSRAYRPSLVFCLVSNSKFHLRDGRTDKRRVSLSVRLPVRSFVRMSLCVLCLSGASILRGERNAMLHINLRGGDLGSTNKHTKFGQLTISKIVTILPPDVCHILKLKYAEFDHSRRLSVYLFVRLCLRWCFDTIASAAQLTHLTETPTTCTSCLPDNHSRRQAT